MTLQKELKSVSSYEKDLSCCCCYDLNIKIIKDNEGVLFATLYRVCRYVINIVVLIVVVVAGKYHDF